MTIESLRQYFAENGVLFATNGWLKKGAIIERSLQTYQDLTDQVYIVGSDTQPIYGRDAFIDMFRHGLDKGYAYLIYIDVDNFIVSPANLQYEFEQFKQSGATFSGPTDGGIICHRNCNRMSPNPFLLMVNLTNLKPIYKNGQFDFGNRKAYDVTQMDPTMLRQWQQTVDAYTAYRTRTQMQIPHTQVISAEWNPDRNKRHHYTMRQIPWSYRDTPNGEPYYTIFLGYLEKFHTGTRFMYAADHPFNADPTGLTTAVYCARPNAQGEMICPENLICLHTWFSRLYDDSNGDPFYRYHHERIGRVADYALEQLKKNTPQPSS